MDNLDKGEGVKEGLTIKQPDLNLSDVNNLIMITNDASKNDVRGDEPVKEHLITEQPDLNLSDVNNLIMITNDASKNDVQGDEPVKEHLNTEQPDLNLSDVNNFIMITNDALKNDVQGDEPVKEHLSTEQPDLNLSDVNNFIMITNDASKNDVRGDEPVKEHLNTEQPDLNLSDVNNFIMITNDASKNDVRGDEPVKEHLITEQPDLNLSDVNNFIMITNDASMDDVQGDEPVKEYLITELPDLNLSDVNNLIMITNDASMDDVQDDEPVKEHLITEQPDLNLSDVNNFIMITNDASKDNVLQDCSHGRTKVKKSNRTWNRRNFCIFCRSLVSNFRRHQLRNHPMEQEVRDFIDEKDPDLKERKKKRQIIFDDLRKRGNFLYNSTLVDLTNILPTRRRSTDDNNTGGVYVTCIYCLGAFSKRTFFRHEIKCPKKQINHNEIEDIPENVPETSDKSLSELLEFGSKKTRNNVLKTSAKLLIPSMKGSDVLKERIFPILRKDEVGLIAMTDPLITTLAAEFLSNHLEKKDEYNVSKKMRDAAKLVAICRKDPEINYFGDCLKPRKFDILMEAVQELSGYDPKTGVTRVIGMPARLAYVIQEGAKILSDQAILSENISINKKDAIKREIADFLQLIKNKWRFRISTNAEKTRKKQGTVKPVVMPDDEDIKILVSKIKTMETEFLNRLSETVNPDNYEKLCKVCIAHIILLNRRRPGEVARAELYYYINRAPNEDLTSDVLEALTDDEVKALPHLTVFMVPGKLVRAVPILLTNTMKSCIDLLISCRNTLKIPVSNKLLFARVYTEYPFDGSKILRELREKCSLKKANFLTATGLRHHIATKTQVYGDDSFTDKICQHLGHTKNIHKQNYRFPLQALQKGQVGHRLLKMDDSWNEVSSTATCNDKELQLVLENVNEDLNGKNVQTDQTVICSPETKITKETDLSYHTESESSDSYSNEDLQPPIKRKRWSDEEKAIVLTNFSSYLKNKTNPGKIKCVELIKKNPILKGRTWMQLNVFINNINCNKMKMPSILGSKRKFEYLPFKI